MNEKPLEQSEIVQIREAFTRYPVLGRKIEFLRSTNPARFKPGNEKNNHQNVALDAAYGQGWIDAVNAMADLQIEGTPIPAAGFKDMSED